MNKILENLNKKGSYYKFNGIIECVRLDDVPNDIIEKLNELKNDNSIIAGYTISDFSVAALDILGIEKYNGKDNNIIELIKSNFDF